MTALRYFALCIATCMAALIGTASVAAPASSKDAQDSKDPLGELLQSLPSLPSISTVVQTMDQMRNEVVMNAVSMVGVLYKRGGNSLQSGLDCSGFVKLVYEQVAGLKLPRTAAEQSNVGTSIAIEDLQPGDLVFYNTLKRPFSHVGIYIGDGQFVHSPRTGKKVTLASMKDRYWSARFEGARRVVQAEQTPSKP